MILPDIIVCSSPKQPPSTPQNMSQSPTYTEREIERQRERESSG